MTSGDGELPFRRTGKSEAAFRTISEVADELDVPQHVLRFWESRFPQVKPLKRGGGRRYYRPEDVVLLRRIRDLLYSEGYTIKGVQKLLRDGGGREDASRSDDADPQLPILMDDGDVEPESDLEDFAGIQAPVPVTETHSLPKPIRQELEKILAELEQLRHFVQPQ